MWLWFKYTIWKETGSANKGIGRRWVELVAIDGVFYGASVGDGGCSGVTRRAMTVSIFVVVEMVSLRVKR